MGSYRTLRLALIGLLAGLVTWVVSEPFARTAENHGVRAGTTTFSIGSFFGWFAHMMLGATIVGFLSYTVSRERMSPAKARLWGLGAMVLGGFLGWFSDSQSDLLSIRLLRSGAIPVFAVHFIWGFFVSMSLALGVALCTQPTVARASRILAGGLAASFASYFLRLVLIPITLLQAALVGGGWRPFDFTRLADHMMMGCVLGLSIALSETLLTHARVRHVIWRNEGRDYFVAGSLNRIGSAEGIEIPIFDDPAIAPIHAHLMQKDGRWWIQDLGSPAGVIVNGQRVPEAWLSGGETLQIGEAMLQFTLKGQEPNDYIYSPVTSTGRVDLERGESLCHRLIDPLGIIHDLPYGVTSLGRDSTATMPFPLDSAISRLHAKVTVTSTETTIEDLGSKNGTLVNGEKITDPVTLNHGDTVLIGTTKLIYRATVS